MDKYKKDAIRGIQSHNQRERKSRSNPDIDYERSKLNYDLHNEQPVNFTEKIQTRIDEMQFKKAIRKDAVYMCGIIISSDLEFFKDKPDSEIRDFFQESYNFLADFVGPENIISAVVHMDEKTPHMHFMHVPITHDKKMCAKDIYTRESLQNLQTDYAIHMQLKGHGVQRGIQKGQGSAKKHLDTADFKQQMEALKLVRQEIADRTAELVNLRSETEVAGNDKKIAVTECAQVKKELEGYIKTAFESRAAATYRASLPKPGLTNARKIYDAAREIISAQKKFVAAQELVMRENDGLKKENKNLTANIRKISDDMAAKDESIQRLNRNLAEAVNSQKFWKDLHADVMVRLKAINEFLKQPQILPQYRSYEALRKRNFVKPEITKTNEIAASKTQPRPQPKRDSGFER